MNVNIFDLLDSNLDLEDEYEKLYELLFERDKFIFGDSFNYSLELLFESHIDDWPYRGTSLKLDEILEKINLQDYTEIEFALEDILKLIQLILNIRLFLENKGYSFNETILFKNIEYILNKLNYKYIKERDKIFVVPKDVEVLSALTNVDKELGILLLDYLDIDLVNNVKKKKNILENISNKMEPNRSNYNKVNKKLTDNVFDLFNKANIRHNNKEGKNKIDCIAKMTNEELISLYDKTYSLVIYLINLDKNNRIHNEVKKLIDEIENSNSN